MGSVSRMCPVLFLRMSERASEPTLGRVGGLLVDVLGVFLELSISFIIKNGGKGRRRCLHGARAIWVALLALGLASFPVCGSPTKVMFLRGLWSERDPNFSGSSIPTLTEWAGACLGNAMPRTESSLAAARPSLGQQVDRQRAGSAPPHRSMPFQTKSVSRPVQSIRVCHVTLCHALPYPQSPSSSLALQFMARTDSPSSLPSPFNLLYTIRIRSYLVSVPSHPIRNAPPHPISSPLLKNPPRPISHPHHNTTTLPYPAQVRHTRTINQSHVLHILPPVRFVRLLARPPALLPRTLVPVPVPVPVFYFLLPTPPNPGSCNFCLWF